MRASTGRLAAVLGLVTCSLAAGVSPAAAQSRRVRVTFQPDCLRQSPGAACAALLKDADGSSRLDYGPQIAVWIEKESGEVVDTVMVTKAVASLGIGNRPGARDFPSALKFPYGKRPQALPVWAFARGRLYPMLMMQNGREKSFGFHESVSSKEIYFCKPLSQSEVLMDAVSCPSDRFSSAKGKFDPAGATTPYPPRNDLATFDARDCDQQGAAAATCAMSAKQFEQLNDLDAVATATPPYGAPYTTTWNVPDTLPDGRYRVRVEVSKEFDTNEVHNIKSHPAYRDPELSDAGLKNNFGQPSVVWTVPFVLDGMEVSQNATTDITGFGDWDGATGALTPGAAAISTAPGSGQGRLLTITVTNGTVAQSGRVHVSVGPRAGTGPVVEPMDGGVSPITDAGPTDTSPAVCPIQTDVGALSAGGDDVGANNAIIRWTEPTAPAFGAIEAYKVRYWNGGDQSEAAFNAGYPVNAPGPGAAGQPTSVEIGNLLSEQTYTVGVQATGVCAQGRVSYRTFMTEIRKFKQLSGCFIATAAYGSPIAAHVGALRAVRDRAVKDSAYARVLVDTYERSSPPVADLLRGSEAGRAIVRTLLGPIVEVARGAEGLEAVVNVAKRR